MARFVRVSSPLTDYVTSPKNVDSAVLGMMDIPERMDEESLQSRLKPEWSFHSGKNEASSGKNRIRVTGDGLFFSADPIQSFFDEEWDW